MLAQRACPAEIRQESVRDNVAASDSSASTAPEIPIVLDTRSANQMQVSFVDGVYSIATVGSDPYIVSQPITADYDPKGIYVLSFDYIWESPGDIQVFFAPPFDEAHSTRLGTIPGGQTWRKAMVNLKARNKLWTTQRWTQLRIDTGAAGGQKLKLRNLVLRTPTHDERSAGKIALAPSLSSGLLRGWVSDLAGDAIADAHVVASDSSSSKVLGETTSREDGAFSLDVSKHVGPGSTGSIEVVARARDLEAKGFLNKSDFHFAQPRFRPIADRVAGLRSAAFLLDGVWRINPSPQGGFQTEPTKGPGWHDFTVPGQWLQQGFDIPRNQPAAVATDFRVPKSWAGKRIILRFEAVHGGTDYWLNGEHLGYSENLFTPVEFDVTDAVRVGAKNHLVLAIKVDTPSETASFSCDYAFHNLGGIDRSIRLFALPRVHLAQAHHETMLDGDFRDAELSLSMVVANTTNSAVSKMTLRVSLRGPDGRPVTLQASRFDLGSLAPGETTVSRRFRIADPPKWSAEKPRLHRLTIQLMESGSVVEELVRHVGFRSVQARGSALWVNGKPVKLAGMCRHEIDPLSGRAATAKHAEDDARLFKEANLNFIRTSHYPPTREFLDACDRIGLYVEVEAPFCWTRGGRGEDDPSLTRQFLTPTAAMVDYHRDHPSVIMWSLANESGTGPDGENRLRPNFEETLKLCRKLDPWRPMIFNNEWCKDGRACDLACLHYPPFPPEEYQFVKDDPRPLFIDEYTLPQSFIFAQELDINPGLDVLLYGAGQNGPNSLWNQLYSSARVIGGSLWAGIDEEFYFTNGAVKGYGLWGIIDVWRRNKSCWWETKLIHSPVWIPVRRLDYRPGQTNLTVPIENRYSFTNLSELTGSWEVGPHKGQCSIALPPGQSGEISLAIPSDTPAGSLLVLRFADSKGMLVTAHGVMLGDREACELPKPEAGCPGWQDDGRIIRVLGNAFAFAVDRTNGLVSSLDGRAVALSAFPVIHCARRESRNPFNPGGLPYAEYPDASGRRIESVSIEKRGEALALTLHDAYAGFEGLVEMVLDTDGTAIISFDYAYSGDAFDLAEAGVRILLDDKCQEISWDRETEWDIYPEDHIGRPKGHAYAMAPEGQGRGVRPPYTSRPTWPWHLDANEYGTRDFRCAKYRIREARLTAPDGSGLMVQSQANADVRACLARDGVQLHVLLSDRPARLSPGDRLKGAFVVRLLRADEHAR